jgi:MtN3 and saliva related transmembrane protein
MTASLDFTEMLGMLAGTLTTISFVPQVLKIWKTKRATDVSWSMFIIFSLGTLFWLIYGLRSHSLPVTLANLITLVLSLLVLFLKWKWRPQELTQ